MTVFIEMGGIGGLQLEQAYAIFRSFCVALQELVSTRTNTVQDHLRLLFYSSSSSCLIGRLVECCKCLIQCVLNRGGLIERKGEWRD